MIKTNVPAEMPENYDGRPGARPTTSLWEDVHLHFKKSFEDDNKLQEICLTADQLVTRMKAAFGGRYNPEVIAQLLRRGYEVKPGQYLFKRDEFIISRTNKYEGQPI